MKNNNLGQSVVELVFAISVIALVVTGVVALAVSDVNSKNRGFDRKKATELAQIVMEDLLQKRKNDAENFWTLDMDKIGLPSACSTTQNYTCSVNMEWETSCANNSCVNVIVYVNWKGSGTQSVMFKRLFSKESH
jgi:Na+-transporting NADH:ubiquinone oxidoreductase subunit NqrC